MFPALLLLAWLAGRRFGRRGREKRTMALVLGCIIVVSFAMSVVVTRVNGKLAFYAAPTRAWEFAVGGLLAIAVPVLVRTDHPRVAAALGVAGALMIGGQRLAVLVWDVVSGHGCSSSGCRRWAPARCWHPQGFRRFEGLGHTGGRLYRRHVVRVVSLALAGPGLRRRPLAIRETMALCARWGGLSLADLAKGPSVVALLTNAAAKNVAERVG